MKNMPGLQSVPECLSSPETAHVGICQVTIDTRGDVTSTAVGRRDVEAGRGAWGSGSRGSVTGTGKEDSQGAQGCDTTSPQGWSKRQRTLNLQKREWYQ